LSWGLLEFIAQPNCATVRLQEVPINPRLIQNSRYFTTELAITNKRVIAKFGLIRRNTIEMNISKVESIQVDQGILGRMFNFGSILVAGAGDPKAPIPGISEPLKFRKMFFEVQEESTNPQSNQAVVKAA
jgi:uncharacterized membrane protein YdbT with pleckstrin-like domain